MAALGLATRDGRTWDDLRKEARRVESEIDLKLASFSKLGSSGGLDADDAERLSMELQERLAILGELNGALAETAGSGGAYVLGHTLARHHEILHDFEKEFRRTRAAVSLNLEQAQLLGLQGRSSGHSFASLVAAEQDEAEQLRRERSSIYSATAKADEVIAQAQAASGTLLQQRSLFSDTMGKTGSLGGKFAIVNSLLSAIRRKKSRDNLIVSGVVAVCTIILLIYWVSK